MALSKTPNPINGTALWKATVRINYKILKNNITKHIEKIFPIQKPEPVNSS